MLPAALMTVHFGTIVDRAKSGTWIGKNRQESAATRGRVVWVGWGLQRHAPLPRQWSVPWGVRRSGGRGGTGVRSGVVCSRGLRRGNRPRPPLVRSPHPPIGGLRRGWRSPNGRPFPRGPPTKEGEAVDGCTAACRSARGGAVWLCIARCSRAGGGAWARDLAPVPRRMFERHPFAQGGGGRPGAGAGVQRGTYHMAQPPWVTRLVLKQPSPRVGH